MKFARILVVALIALLWSMSALPQDSTPSAPQAAPPQNQAQPQTAAPPAAAANQPQTTPPAAADLPLDTMPRRYIDVWNTGNFDGMASLFWAQTAIYSHGNRVLLKPEMLRRVVTAWRKSMPDLTFKIEDTIIQGDKVVMRLSFRGSYKERLFANTDEPANTPRTVHATEMVIFQIERGKIRQIWEEYDEMMMRLQMGGFWRSNQELAAAWVAARHPSKPAPDKAPPVVSPPKP